MSPIPEFLTIRTYIEKNTDISIFQSTASVLVKVKIT